MRRALRIGLITSVVLLALWVVLGGVIAYAVTSPRPRTFDNIADLGGHKVEAVTFKAMDDHDVSAWFVPLENTDKAIVFTHGIGGDRRQQEANMDFYLKRGFTALAIDSRGHGMSQPDMVTMGWNERKDLLGAVRFLKERGYKHIGADGISLGAATICYAFQDKPDLSFVILESSYDTIENALNNRLAIFGAPAWLAYSFRWFSTWMIGAGPEELRPLEYMKQITVPTLVLAGDNEAEIPVDETQSMFDACGASVKEMFLFKGATHRNRLVKNYEEDYTRVVDGFLAKVFPAVAVTQ